MGESSVDQQFAAANQLILNGGKNGPKLSNQQKLTFYALFKQANQGECTGKQPGRAQFVARAKFDAWKALGKMTQQEAKAAFVTEFLKVMPNAKL